MNIETNLEGKLDSKKEILNWQRLIITTLLVVIGSTITSSLTWFILDRTFNESQQNNAALVAILERKITYLDNRLSGAATTTTTTTNAATVDPLTQQKILNATYQIDGKSYTAVNGAVKLGDNTVTIKSDKSVVNRDNAFVVLNLNTGGSGYFYYLVYMVNNAGSPVQADIASLGDRTQVNSVTYSDSKVVLDMIVVGPNDSNCCPTQKITKNYSVSSGKLNLIQ